MNAIVRSKVFKSGNSAAVRLPKELGLKPGTAITLERHGTSVTIRPAEDKEAIRREWEDFARDIEAIWASVPDREVQRREQPVAPERHGLM